MAPSLKPPTFVSREVQPGETLHLAGSVDSNGWERSD